MVATTASTGQNGDFLRADPELVERRHRAAPVAGGLRQFLLGKLHLDQFSAWAKVSAETSGPTGGAVPKAGGAPGVASVCWL